VAVIEGNLNGYKTTLVIQHFGAPSAAMVAAKPVSAKEALAAEPQSAESTVAASETETLVSGTENIANSVINPLAINKGIGGFLFGLIVGALIVDTYFVLRNKVHRFSGRNIAHVGFIALMFFMILLSQQGVVN